MEENQSVSKSPEKKTLEDYQTFINHETGEMEFVHPEEEMEYYLNHPPEPTWLDPNSAFQKGIYGCD